MENWLQKGWEAEEKRGPKSIDSKMRNEDVIVVKIKMKKTLSCILVLIRDKQRDTDRMK